MNRERSTLFLMANLGSEIVRCMHFREQKDDERARASAERAFAIIDSILIRDNAGAKQEAVILKSVVEDCMRAEPRLAVTVEEMNAYFVPLGARVLALGF